MYRSVENIVNCQFLYVCTYRHDMSSIPLQHMGVWYDEGNMFMIWAWITYLPMINIIRVPGFLLLIG